MVKESQNKRTVAQNEIFITHFFNAPVELVFSAWTDSKLLERWFAPNGCTIKFKKMDFRECGTFHSCISNPIHGDCWCIGEYLEIIKFKRIVYTMQNADENGKAVDPLSIGMDADWPKISTVYITFEEVEGKTKLTLEQTVNETLAKKTGAYPSWIQMLDNLDVKLKTI